MEKIKVNILNDQKLFTVSPKLKKLVKDTVSAVMRFEGVEDDIEVSVRFVNNRQIRTLDAKMRGLSKATDVLSFPSGDYPKDEFSDDGYCYLGDIAISLERAEKQRKMYGHSFEREVSFLTAHSCLHLLGYDHMEPEEEKEMFDRQEKILSGMGMER